MKSVNLFLLCIVLTLVSCNNNDNEIANSKPNDNGGELSLIENIEKKMTIVLNTYSNYDAEQVRPGLENHKLNMIAYLKYNEDWTGIIQPLYFEGLDTSYDGFVTNQYLLNENSEAIYYSADISNGYQEIERLGVWDFDSTELTITLLERNGKVVAFGGGILVFDETDTKANNNTQHYRSVYTILDAKRE